MEFVEKSRRERNIAIREHDKERLEQSIEDLESRLSLDIDVVQALAEENTEREEIRLRIKYVLAIRILRDILYKMQLQEQGEAVDPISLRLQVTQEELATIRSHLSEEERVKAQLEGLALIEKVLDFPDGLPLVPSLNQLLAVQKKRDGRVFDLNHNQIGIKFVRQTRFLGVEVVNSAFFPNVGLKDGGEILVLPL